MNPHVGQSFIPFVAGIVLCAIVIHYSWSIAHDIGLVDKPNERKQHGEDIPLTGGVSIFLAFYLSLFLVPFGLGIFRYLLFSVALVVIIGILDDHQDISPLVKSSIQVIAAVLLVSDELVVTAIGDIFNWQDGNLQGLGLLAKPFTVIAIVGLINAYNFIDGHDGLSAAMLLISLAALAYLSGIGGLWKIQYVLLLFMSCVVVFFAFNAPLELFRLNKVFLGDAGSMMFGLMLIFFLITLSENTPVTLKATSAPWIVGLPLIDMIAVIVKRLLKRLSLARPDRQHIHHVLSESGLSKLAVLVVLIVIQCIFVGFGLVGTLADLPDWLMFWGMFPVAALYMFIVSMMVKKNEKTVSQS